MDHAFTFTAGQLIHLRVLSNENWRSKLKRKLRGILYLGGLSLHIRFSISWRRRYSSSSCKRLSRFFEAACNSSNFDRRSRPEVKIVAYFKSSFWKISFRGNAVSSLGLLSDGSLCSQLPFSFENFDICCLKNY